MRQRLKSVGFTSAIGVICTIYGMALILVLICQYSLLKNNFFLMYLSIAILRVETGLPFRLISARALPLLLFNRVLALILVL